MKKTRYTMLFLKNHDFFGHKITLIATFLTLFFSANAADFYLLGDAITCDFSNTAHWAGNNFPDSLASGDNIYISYSSPVNVSNLDMNFTLPEGVNMYINNGKQLQVTGSQVLTVDQGANILLDTLAGIFVGVGCSVANSGMIQSIADYSGTLVTFGGGIYSGTGVMFVDNLGLSEGGQVTIEVGTKINVYTELTMRDGDLGTAFTVNGALNLSGIFSPAFTQPGTIRGTGEWRGQFEFLSEGQIAPGNSPGIFTATQGFVQGGAELVMEINGLVPGTDHDQLIVTIDTTLLDTISKLKLVFGANGFAGDTFDIIKSQFPIIGIYRASNISLVRAGTNVGDVEIIYFANKIQAKILSIVLPVELVSFSAKTTRNRVVELDWKTASETNNQGFEIQFSSKYNQNEWETIGFERGNGTTNDAHEYHFTHENAPSGQLFYRLRQLDFDGKSEFSPVRFVKISGQSVAQFEPSIVENGQTTLHFLGEMPAQDGLLRIYAADGRLVFEQNLEAEKEHVSLRLPDFSSGIFTAQLIFENEKSQVLRLVVR